MKKTVSLIIFALLSLSLLLAANFAPSRAFLSDISLPLRHGLKRERHVMVQMRDGVRLNTEIYTPAAGGKHPVILIRTTYLGSDFSINKHFVSNGYAVVVQYARGRHGSEGTYESPHKYSGVDGYDTIDWIVQQPWATDKIGTFGCSYRGESQIMLASHQHPNHLAMIVDGAGGAIGKAKESYGYFGVFENGVLNLASSLGWYLAEGAKEYNATPAPGNLEESLRTKISNLPISALSQSMVDYQTGFDDLLVHELTDPWWDAEGYITDQDRFSAATLHINAWFDQTVHDSFRLAQVMQENQDNMRAASQPLILGPGTHCSAGDLESGSLNIGELQIDYTDPDYLNIYLQWFDYWLKGEGENQFPAYKYYVINGPGWESSSTWPPQNVESQRFYLGMDSSLDSEPPDEVDTALAFDEFIYNPENPVPSLGGTVCCTYDGTEPAGSVDQSSLEERSDVLLFRSAELESATDLIGNVRVALSASTSALDTDFTAKIVDIHEDGSAYNLQDGIVRLRYRNGIEAPELAVPGQIYELEIELRPIAYRFEAGHRIGIQVSSSNFPRLARNLNTGQHEYSSDEIVAATNRIFWSAANPSYIELPLRDQQ